MQHKGTVVVLAATIALTALVLLADESGTFTWPQWGQNPQHQGFVNVLGQPLNGVLADIVYDPLVPDEQLATGGELLAHYQVPILDGEDVFMEFKTGTFDGSTFNTEVWHEKRLHWENGQLVEKWQYTTDWKPEPIDFVGGWEPVFHAVLAGGSIYVPGLGGTLFKLDRGNGQVVAHINPFGTTIDPNTFVSGPPSTDGNGNVYYNVIQLDSTETTIGSWLVKVGSNDGTSKVSYATLVPDAPTGSNQCELPFGNNSLPWPPSPTAKPALAPFPCGLQRAGVNVAPTIAPDGTIYTISRADNFTRYGYMVAVNADLTPKWDTSLRVNLLDGCGVTIPIAPTSTPLKGSCRNGANFGVDPDTNHGGEGRVIDQSSSSPTVLPDGSVLYGAYSRYNVSRGHLLKFSSTGTFLKAFDFGWDSTPAVFSHDGTYSIVIKDNHYDEEEGFYCNPTGGVSNIVCASTGIPAGPFYITQFDANLVPEWKFHSIETKSCTRNPDGTLSCVSNHPNGFEWCINAPAIDVNHTVYVESEDGNAYMIPPGHTGIFDMNTPGVNRLFLQLALGAAYTPLSIGPDGKIYTQNAGHLFVIGAGGKPSDPFPPHGTHNGHFPAQTSSDDR